VNNDIDPAVMKSAVVTFGDEGGWQLTGIGGMLDRESFYGLAARDIISPDPFYQFGSDGYDAFRLAIPLGGWTIGGNWLASGADTENGWSVDLTGKLFGRKIWAEYAKLREDFSNDEDLTGGDKAWVAGLNLIDSASLKLGASYGEVDSDYFVLFSLLNPQSQYAADYIDWADRPLFLSKDNVAKGWEVVAELPRLFGEGNSVKVRYYDGKQYDWFAPEGNWMDADAVWTVTWTRALAANADFSLMYGQRETKNVLRNTTEFGTANQDSLKTLRAEFLVRF